MTSPLRSFCTLIFMIATASAVSEHSAPTDAVRSRLQHIVREILPAWDHADVVCLGEGHGSKNDSDLRILLVEHPDFVRKVDVIIIEFADVLQQDLLDRFILQGEKLSREQLRAVWKDTVGKEVWESPIYEAFIRTVQKVNSTLPPDQRIRLLAGDHSGERNRGKFIRGAVSREILSKDLKGLAIYGSGHCERRGMGFPGELQDQYPGKLWAVSGFYDVDAGRNLFELKNEPQLIRITGTEKGKIPAGKMFFSGRYDDSATLGDLFDAIVYYGDLKDQIVGRD